MVYVKHKISGRFDKRFLNVPLLHEKGTKLNDTDHLGLSVPSHASCENFRLKSAVLVAGLVVSGRSCFRRWLPPFFIDCKPARNAGTILKKSYNCPKFGLEHADYIGVKWGDDCQGRR